MSGGYTNFKEIEEAVRSSSPDVKRDIAEWNQFAKEHSDIASMISRHSGHSINQTISVYNEVAKLHPDILSGESGSRIRNGLLLLQEGPHVEAAPGSVNPPITSDSERQRRTDAHPTDASHNIGDKSALNFIRGRNKYMEDDEEYVAKKVQALDRWHEGRADFIDGWEKDHGKENGMPEKDDGRFQGNEEKYNNALENWRANSQARHNAIQQSHYSADAELDYLYGSLDPESQLPTLADDTKTSFYKTLEERRFLGRGKRLRSRYEQSQIKREGDNNGKLWSNPDKDPYYQEFIRRIEEHQLARELLEYEKALKEIDEAERENYTFDKFRKDKRFSQKLTLLRRRVAEAERRRFATSRVTGKPTRKSVTYSGHINAYFEKYIYTQEGKQQEPGAPMIPIPIPIPMPGIGAPPPQMEQPNPEQNEEPGEEQDQGQQQDEEGGATPAAANQKNQRKKKKNRLAEFAKNKAKKAVKKAGEDIGKKILQQILARIIQPIISFVIQLIMDFLGSTVGEWIIGIIGAIAIIILVIWLLSLLFQPPTIVQLKCGDSNIKAIQGREISTFTTDINNYFFLDYFPLDARNKDSGNWIPIGDSPDSYKHNQTVKATEDVVNTLCVLFGHVKENPAFTSESYINTFGTLVVGTTKQGRSGGDSGSRGRGDALDVAIFTEFDDSSSSCESKYTTTQGDGSTRLEVRIKNPDKCTSIYQLQFNIAQGLGYALMDQQNNQYIHDPKIFNSFKSPTGPYNNPYLLPTGGCELSPSPNPRDCFADMVGEYFTYPYYFDSNGSYITPTDIPTPTPQIPEATITIIQGKLSITPAPTYPPVTPTLNSPLSDFPTGKYKAYYDFAYNNLFDGIDFYGGVHPQAPLPPPDLRAGIKKQFGIDFASGFSTQELTWTWNKFWDISGTNFFKLLGNWSKISVTISTNGWDTVSYSGNNCTVSFRTGAHSEEDWDVILIHEFGHCISWLPNQLSHSTDLPGVINADKLVKGDKYSGYMTYYSDHADYSHNHCDGIGSLTEDYPEAVTYYLNPKYVEQTLCRESVTPPESNPYANNRQPNHMAFIRRLLGPY